MLILLHVRKLRNRSGSLTAACWDAAVVSPALLPGQSCSVAAACLTYGEWIQCEEK